MWGLSFVRRKRCYSALLLRGRARSLVALSPFYNRLQEVSATMPRWLRCPRASWLEKLAACARKNFTLEVEVAGLGGLLHGLGIFANRAASGVVEALLG